MQKPWTDRQIMEFRFKERYTRFKIWLALKDKNNKTFYGVEANCTALQIASGRVTEVLFDKRKSYGNCLYLEEKYRNDYETAILYEKRNKQWVEVARYRLGNLVEYEEVDFADALLLTEVVRGKNYNWSLKLSAKAIAVTTTTAAAGTKVATAPPTTQEQQQAAGIAARRDAIAAKWKVS